MYSRVSSDSLSISLPATLLELFTITKSEKFDSDDTAGHGTSGGTETTESGGGTSTGDDDADTHGHGTNTTEENVGTGHGTIKTAIALSS